MNEYREIPLTKGYVTIVDAADYDWLMQWGWYYQSCSSVHGYAAHHFPAGVILMHRYLLNPLPGFHVDHINGNALDNRRQNIRVCTRSENMYNRKVNRTNRAKFKGVVLYKGIIFSRIKVNGRGIYLGTFQTEEDAALAYDAAALKHFGAFARLNFPERAKQQAAARS